MRNLDQYVNPTGAVLAEESASVFMRRVYTWMVGGLSLTAGTAWLVASNPVWIQAVMRLFTPLIIAQLVVVFAFSALAPRVNTPVAAGLFLGYSFLNGLTFSSLFLRYSLGSISSVFLITAVMFGALSVYATVTKRNLSTWGTFLFMGLIGMLVASVVNIFLGSSLLGFVVSCAGVLVFAGLTAYDTQKLREMHASSGFSSAGTLAIRGALVLYLDFINMFIYLLRLFGNRR